MTYEPTYQDCEVNTERALIAHIFLGGESIAYDLDVSLFTDPLCVDVLKAIKKVLNDGLPVELPVVLDVMRKSDKVTQNGGITAISSLLDSPALANPSKSITVLTRAKARRELRFALAQVVSESTSSRQTATEFIEQSVSKINNAVASAESALKPVIEFATSDWLTTREITTTEPVCKVLGVSVGRPCLLAGTGSSGKTFLAQDLIINTMIGKPLFGYRPPNAAPKRVVHIDYEMGKSSTFIRYRALIKKYDDEESKEYLTNESFLNSAFLVSSIPDMKMYMTDPSFRSVMTKALNGASLCVIDSLRASLPGIDENDSQIGSYLNTLTAISIDTNCAIMVIHHASKGKEGANVRGSSAIRDACGAVWVVDNGDIKGRKKMKLSKPPADFAISDFEIEWYFDRFDIVNGQYYDVRIER